MSSFPAWQKYCSTDTAFFSDKSDFHEHDEHCSIFPYASSIVPCPCDATMGRVILAQD